MSLADDFLAQSPACHWILSAAGKFERIYGDTVPVLGKPAAELLGRTVGELDPDLAANWTQRVARVVAGETLALRDRRGEHIWNVAVFPMRTEAGIGFAGATAREITPWSTAEQELRLTVLSALKAMEFERKNCSHFLHDVVGQNLTALGLQLDLLRIDFPDLAQRAAAPIAEMQALLEEMMEKVRAYSHELNPATVERAGLRPALDRLAIRLRERFLGTIRMNVDPSTRIEPRIASALYQIAQEAADNAVAHSGCSMIEIAVRGAGERVHMEVRDNGKGFDPSDLGGSRGLGIIIMEHYAAQAGLELKIASGRGRGTTIRAIGAGRL